MDLRAYYKKLREIEKELRDEFVVVKSLATPDGGIAGRLTEVSRAVAAKMIADGMAVTASVEEAAGLRRKVSEEKVREDEKRASAQLQLAVLTRADLRAIQGTGRRRRKE